MYIYIYIYMYMHVCSLCCLVISSKAKVFMQDVSHESTKPRMSGASRDRL